MTAFRTGSITMNGNVIQSCLAFRTWYSYRNEALSNLQYSFILSVLSVQAFHLTSSCHRQLQLENPQISKWLCQTCRADLERERVLFLYIRNDNQTLLNLILKRERQRQRQRNRDRQTDRQTETDRDREILCFHTSKMRIKHY